MANLLSTTVNGQLNTGNVIDLGYTVNGSIATTAFRGINFHSFGDLNYYIGKPSGAWTQPLHIHFYTGIWIRSHHSYGGTRFYNIATGSNLMSIGDGADNINVYAKITSSITSGTVLSHGSMDDAIGWNSSYGTYIGSTVGGTYYIYGNGRFYDNGTIRTLIHSGNIGSQSVNYASSAGNADTLDSLDSSEFARGRAAYQVLNLDTAKQPGLYQYDGGIGGTQPAGTNWYNVKTIEIGSEYRYSQFVMPYSENRIFYRYKVDAGWQPYVELITSGNISSQSVNYANSAGSAPANGGTSTYSTYLNPLSGDSNYKLAYTADGARSNAGEWGRAVMLYVPNGQTYGIRVDRADYSDNTGALGGIGVGGFLRDDGWNTYPGQDANTQGEMRVDFTYSNNAPYTGELIRFGSSGYSTQFNTSYGNSDNFAFRTRNGDNGTWNTWKAVIHSGNIASQSVSYADESGYSSSSGSVEWTSVQNKPATFPPSTHNHDDRYLVKGGSWYGLGLPGSRWGGFSVSGGEIVFGDGLPNAGQMGILIDGAYLAGENNGFWSLPSDNSWSGRRGMYWDGSNLNFTANSPTALFNSIRLSTSTNNGTISGGGDWGIRFANDNGWIQFGPANNSWTHIYSDKNFYMNTHLWVSGGYKVTAWDYNNGGGALYATVFYDANDTGYYVDPNSTSQLNTVYAAALYGSDVYTNGGWFRNHSNTNGIYWSTTGWHLFPATTADFRIHSGNSSESALRMETNGTTRGYVYVNSSNEIGFLNEGRTWRLRVYSGGAVESYGDFRAPIFYDSNDTNYYVDPNSTSVLNALTLNGRLNAYSNIVYLNEIRFTNTAGSTQSDPYTMRWISEDSTRGAGLSWLEFQLNDDSNEEIRIYGNSCVGYSCGTYSDNLYHRFRADGYAWHAGTMESPTVYGSTTVYSPTILVNNHSDNTKGYRIHNTSGSSVSAMFTNSSNQLVIGAGAFDRINLNKNVYLNGTSLGINVTPSATVGRIDAANDIVAYSSSDERLKYNITPIENAIDKVKSLTGVEFDWKPEYKHAHGYEGHDTGIIAQQVQEVIPSAVRTNDTGFLAVRYEKLIGLLVEGMKEQQAQIEELKAKLDGLTK
jgi:hypothetical protein